MSGRPQPVWPRIEQGYIPEPNSGCHLWLGNLSTKGYAQMRVNGRTQQVHRVVYELMKGPIPEGLQIDHLCRVRCCVNSDHMEAVTGKENVARGLVCVLGRVPTCPKGHTRFRYSINKYGRNQRECLDCRAILHRQQRRRKNAR